MNIPQDIKDQVLKEYHHTRASHAAKARLGKMTLEEKKLLSLKMHKAKQEKKKITENP